MDERAAARAFEEELTSVPPGLQGRVAGRRGDFRESIEVAEKLRALASEWGRHTPPALQQEIASLAERAGNATADRGIPVDRSVRRRVVRVGVAVTVAATLLIVAVPAARDGVARQLHRVLDVVSVGAATEIVRPDTSTPEETAATLRQAHRDLAAGRMWYIHTAYGGFGGDVPPGASPTLQRVDRLEVLPSVTSMPIQLPTVPHRGAIPAFNHALVAPDGFLFLFVGSGSDEILIVQAPVGGGRGMSSSRSVAGTDAHGRYYRYSPELKPQKLVLNGHTVIWDPDTTALTSDTSALRWEWQGITYALKGRGLTRDEAVDLFLSLRPAPTPD